MHPSPWRPLRKSPRPYFTKILVPFSAKPGQIWPTRRKAISTHRSIQAKPAWPSCRSRRVSATPPNLSPCSARRRQNRQGGLKKGPKMSEFEYDTWPVRPGRPGQAGQARPGRPGQAGQLGHCRIVGASWANVQMSNSSALKRSPVQLVTLAAAATSKTALTSWWRVRLQMQWLSMR